MSSSGVTTDDVLPPNMSAEGAVIGVENSVTES